MFRVDVESLDDLDAKVLTSLFAEISRVFAADPSNPVRYRQGS